MREQERRRQDLEQLSLQRRAWMPLIYDMFRQKYEHDRHWELVKMDVAYRRQLDLAGLRGRQRVEQIELASELGQRRAQQERQQFWEEVGGPLFRAHFPEVQGVEVGTTAELHAAIDALTAIREKQGEAEAIEALSRAFDSPAVQALARTGDVSKVWSAAQIEMKQRAEVGKQERLEQFAATYAPQLLAGIRAGLTPEQAAARSPQQAEATIAGKARAEYRAWIGRITMAMKPGEPPKPVREREFGLQTPVHRRDGWVMSEGEFIEKRLDEARELGLLPGRPAATVQLPPEAGPTERQIRGLTVPAPERGLAPGEQTQEGASTAEKKAAALAMLKQMARGEIGTEEQRIKAQKVLKQRGETW